MDAYDYVIVGGGTAGCVLAARLSLDPRLRVLLLEAGPAEGPAAVGDPGARNLLLGSAIDWADSTVEQAATGRCEAVARGKMLGGTSSISEMVHTRGHRAGYDAWAAAGARGWGYEELLPYFKRSERVDGGDARYRGTSGPMQLALRSLASPLLQAYFDAAVEAGHPVSDDLNGAEQEGVGWVERNIVAGIRQSAADAYLRRAQTRSNLDVVTGATVTRLCVEGGRCRGVEYVVDGVAQSAPVGEEVVLAAGTIGSAQLLMVSGIGPGAHLRSVGVDVVADLPGVGANLHDHVQVATIVEASDEALPLFRWRESQDRSFMVRLRTDPTAREPDIQVIGIPRPYHATARPDIAFGFSLVVGLMTPVSRGILQLADGDVTTPPLIDPNYLADEYDVARLAEGLRQARAIADQPRLRRWRGAEILPGPDVRDELDLRCYVRSAMMTQYHHVGTCRMGTGSDAVVDPGLRVRGIAGLRVADASIIPSIPSANTHATVLAIAERAAALILAGD